MAVVEFVAQATEEQPIRIFLNDVPVAVSQGSPYGLGELAVGYLLSEGLITDREQLAHVRIDEDASEVRVVSSEVAEEGYVPLHRVTSAGCAKSALLKGTAIEPVAPVVGACGGTGADGGATADAAALDGARFSADALLAQMDELCERSPRRNTGECVHACGLGTGDAQSLIMAREDIGRHNAMDKLIGQAWLDRVDVRDKALFITGRISAEMALKAYRAGCPVLVSRKSATNEAVRSGEELGITLVSHCREGGMRVLSHPERIKVD